MTAVPKKNIFTPVEKNLENYKIISKVAKMGEQSTRLNISTDILTCLTSTWVREIYISAHFHLARVLHV
jgi:hypothetical protein